MIKRTDIKDIKDNLVNKDLQGKNTVLSKKDLQGKNKLIANKKVLHPDIETIKALITGMVEFIKNPNREEYSAEYLECKEEVRKVKSIVLSTADYQWLGISPEGFKKLISKFLSQAKTDTEGKVRSQQYNMVLPNTPLIFEEFLNMRSEGQVREPNSFVELLMKFKNNLQLHHGIRIIRIVQITLLYDLLLHIREFDTEVSISRTELAKLLYASVPPTNIPTDKDNRTFIELMRDRVTEIKKATTALVTVMLNKKLGGFINAFNNKDIQGYIGEANTLRVAEGKVNDSYYINLLLFMFIFQPNPQAIKLYFTTEQVKQITTYLEEIILHYKVIYCAENTIKRCMNWYPATLILQDIPERNIPVLLNLCDTKHIYMAPSYLLEPPTAPVSTTQFTQILRAIEGLTIRLGSEIIVNLRDIYIQAYITHIWRKNQPPLPLPLPLPPQPPLVQASIPPLASPVAQPVASTTGEVPITSTQENEIPERNLQISTAQDPLVPKASTKENPNPESAVATPVPVIDNQPTKVTE